jgi:hypothetical protein
LEVPDYLAETPLYFDDIYIQNYTRTPLYNRLVLNECYCNGKVDNLQQYINSIPIKKLTFHTKHKLTIDEVNGVVNILFIALCKKFHYPITNIVHYYDNGHHFVPKINAHDIYDTDDHVALVHNTIVINNFIGYTSILNNKYEEIDHDILCSDLIWMCPLENYINMLDIPIIKIEDDILYKSSLIERGANDMDHYVDTIRNLMKHSFLIDIIYKDIVEEFINVYHFVLVGYSLNNQICLQHSYLDKQWFLNAIYNIYNNNKLPMISLVDKWVFSYEPTPSTQAALKYAATKAIMETNDKVLSKHIHDITVGSDLIVSIPFLSSDTNDIIIKINLYMKQKVYNTTLLTNNKIILPPLQLPGQIDNNFITADSKLYTLDQIDKITERQLQYLWSSGRFLNDWAYNYYNKFRQISQVPLLNTSDVLYHLESNV